VNPHCVCPAAGFCSRHQRHKGPEQHRRCRGESDRHDCGLSHWNAWEQGKAGATAPADPQLNPPGFCSKQQPNRRRAAPCVGCNEPRSKSVVGKMRDRAFSLASAAVDFWRDGMTLATEEQQRRRLATCEACPVFSAGWCDQAKGGCGCNLALKVKARAAFCPQGKWFAHGDNYRPLVQPKRHLMFHLYPLRGKEWNWHWHVEQLAKHQQAFQRIVIGVGIDQHTATEAEVRQQLQGVAVTDWVIADNTVALAETHTHVAMLERLQTDDENTIIMRYHTKGVTKTPDAVEQRWAELLWESCMYLQSVEDALASHLTCGPMRSLTPLVTRKPGDFFFAGSAYWFRAAEAFSRDWRHTDATRWWVEYFPCHVFNRAESACLLYDLTESSVIRSDYFSRFIQPEWDAWRLSRSTSTPSTD
jgi:Uri superfamily endonuclease